MGAWSGWNALGGVLTSEPAPGRNLDGRLEVFARGTDDALWHIWQVTPGGAWSGWNSLGGVITSTPWVIQNVDGRLEVFARGTDGAVWHRWQMAPGAPQAFEARGIDGAWSRGTDIWQVTPGGGWSAWNTLGGVIVVAAVAHAGA